MNISDRLKTVASLITAGNSVADIGTDHGYIPIYLALNNLTKKAVAMDINEGPLSRAADNIQKYNVGNCVETRISDGLCGLAEDEVDTIVIAGMGGLLINRILEDNMKVALSAKEIILSPHSDVPKVREFLADNGLMVTDEVMVKDEGKYYFVLKAVKGHDDIEERELYKIYGHILFEHKDKVFYEYLINEKKKRENILEKMSESSNSERKATLKKESELITEGLIEYESI